MARIHTPLQPTQFILLKILFVCWQAAVFEKIYDKNQSSRTCCGWICAGDKTGLVLWSCFLWIAVSAKQLYCYNRTCMGGLLNGLISVNVFS